MSAPAVDIDIEGPWFNKDERTDKESGGIPEDVFGSMGQGQEWQ